MTSEPGMRGGVRVAGRAKGTPNKDRNEILSMLQEEARRLTGEKNYDPLRAILRLIEDQSNGMKINDRLRGHATISEFVHSKRKAIDISGTINTHEATLDELE